MQLADLFVSYKQVKSPRFEIPENIIPNYEFPQFNSAQQTEQEEQKISSPKTQEIKYFFTPIEGQQSKASSKWISPYVRNKNKWIQDMTNAYKKAGLSDNAIKNLLAKNASESGWGKSAQGNYNFGNITTGSNWNGNYVMGKDKDANGQSISQKFRAYNSIDDYVKDEIQFLTKLYNFDQNDSFDQFINKLQGQNSGKRFYAQDKDYKDKVRQVYNNL